PFYGHEATARLCTRFITNLFQFPKSPSSAAYPEVELPYFIAYTLHRTKLHPCIAFATHMLLQRLKARFPTAQCTSARRLFTSAYMIMSKVIWEDTYSNKSWRVATQEIYSLREINQMEREMCGYVDWELTVDSKMLSDFEMMVAKDYSQDRTSYLNYPLTMVSKRAAVAAAAKAAPTTSTP
ncbi:hypothetical protein FA13DRAFT_1590924, partial [Coprinellus micaceus]